MRESKLGSGVDFLGALKQNGVKQGLLVLESYDKRHPTGCCAVTFLPINLKVCRKIHVQVIRL
jgi:hypothetical protein